MKLAQDVCGSRVTEDALVVRNDALFKACDDIHADASSWETASEDRKCCDFHAFRRVASVVIETWRHHYNEVRPHSSLQYWTPVEFKQQLRQDPQPADF